MTTTTPRQIPWLDPGDPFPPVNTAWGEHDPAPGLLAAGGVLDVATLLSAYQQGVFPWFNEGQPLLWWSTDPRMVLRPQEFHLRRSLAKTLRKFSGDARCTVTMDADFPGVIRACASAPRAARKPGLGTLGIPPETQRDESDEGSATWIGPEIMSAYIALHQAGWAHSVEVRVDGELVGGLYCVSIGQAVFGESMFSHRTDASKIALAGLVAFCLAQGIEMIDCQQTTPHLTSLGATQISREHFVQEVACVRLKPSPRWQFETVYWKHLSI